MSPFKLGRGAVVRAQEALDVRKARHKCQDRETPDPKADGESRTNRRRAETMPHGIPPRYWTFRKPPSTQIRPPPYFPPSTADASATRHPSAPLARNQQAIANTQHRDTNIRLLTIHNLINKQSIIHGARHHVRGGIPAGQQETERRECAHRRDVVDGESAVPGCVLRGGRTVPDALNGGKAHDVCHARGAYRPQAQNDHETFEWAKEIPCGSGSIHQTVCDDAT
jgi:hypothetical protein